MADSHDLLLKGIYQGLDEIFGNEEIIEVLSRRDPEDLIEVGRSAARLAVAPLLWDARLGAMLDTGQVTERLGKSRQAVAKDVDARRLIAIPAARTRRFPVWQFNFFGNNAPNSKAEIRPAVAQIVGAFQEIYPAADAHQIAAWAMTPQPELDGETPAQWLDKAEDLGPVLDAASRAAYALAQ
jgi:hypothetical protein